MVSWQVTERGRKKARRTTKKEEPLWAEPEALENNGQRSSA